MRPATHTQQNVTQLLAPPPPPGQDLHISVFSCYTVIAKLTDYKYIDIVNVMLNSFSTLNEFILIVDFRLSPKVERAQITNIQHTTEKLMNTTYTLVKLKKLILIYNQIL